MPIISDGVRIKPQADHNFEEEKILKDRILNTVYSIKPGIVELVASCFDMHKVLYLSDDMPLMKSCVGADCPSFCWLR
jgi:hypothetical protein